MTNPRTGTPADPVLEVSVKETDLGNCTRFVRDWQSFLRYVPAWKSYVVWDGAKWVRDDEGRAVELAKRTVKGIYREAAYAETEDERKALGKWAIKSEGIGRIQAMIELGKSEPGIPVDADAFDADPWLLNLANGTVDVRTGVLEAHAPARLITKQLPITYETASPCPQWLAFLHEIMGGNVALVEFLQRAVGYALTGDTREQVLFILWGGGANGKSTFLNVLTSLLGSYAMHTPMDTFMQKPFEGIPNDIARLHGVRFVAASEAESQRRLAEALIKSLTGGEKIVARFLHKEFFEYTPRFKIFFATNHKPVIRGNDLGIWRRIRLVPFTVTIAPERQDKELADKLAGEAAGILAWAIEGCRKWREDGLREPDEVKVATEEYRGEMDSVGAFIEERCEVGSTLTVSTKALYAAYASWCQEAGEKPMTQTSLSTRLRERGFVPDRTKTLRFWTGLAVHDVAETGGSGDTARTAGEDDPVLFSSDKAGF